MIQAFLLFTLFAHCPQESKDFLDRYEQEQVSGVQTPDVLLMAEATHLLQSRVNAHLPVYQALSFSAANEMLFEAITYVRHHNKRMVLAEVPLATIKILQDCSWKKAETIFLERLLNSESEETQ